MEHANANQETHWSNGKLREWIKGGCDIEVGRKVKSLRCSSCGLCDLPSDVVFLSNLEYLYLYNNKIKSVPHEILCLSKLKYLDMSFNELSNIDDLVSLTNLTHLLLTKNKIKTIPLSIKKLYKLKALYIAQNELKMLPSQLHEMNNLQCVSYDGNIFVPKNVERMINKMKAKKLSDITDETYHTFPYDYFPENFHNIQNYSKKQLSCYDAKQIINNENKLSVHTKKNLLRQLNRTCIHPIFYVSSRELILNVINYVIDFYSHDSELIDTFFCNLNSEIEKSPGIMSMNNIITTCISCVSLPITNNGPVLIPDDIPVVIPCDGPSHKKQKI